ncbi:MAG: hypothetical protein IPF97_06290 [Sphingomonadales bacterium]|nr:hypothetical protein [Sphingomonadales bacterium]
MHEFAGEMPDVIKLHDFAGEIGQACTEDAVAPANVPATLLMVIVQLTGDLSWLDPPYHPTRGRGLNENDTGGFAEDLQKDQGCRC